MHIVHLACLGDALTSMLLDLSDSQWPWPGSSRDARLEHAWQSYKEYCQNWNIADRCERKLFTNETLRYDYVTVSQKVMRAAAAKFMVFWMHWFMDSLLQGDPEQPEHLKCPGQGESFGLNVFVFNVKKPSTSNCKVPIYKPAAAPNRSLKPSEADAGGCYRPDEHGAASAGERQVLE